MIKKVLPLIVMAQGAHMYGQKGKSKDKKIQKEAAKKKLKQAKKCPKCGGKGCSHCGGDGYHE